MIHNWYNRWVSYRDNLVRATEPLSLLWEIAQNRANTHLDDYFVLPEPFFSSLQRDEWDERHITTMTWIVRLPEKHVIGGPWGSECPWQLFKVRWNPSHRSFLFTDYHSSVPGYKTTPTTDTKDEGTFWSCLQALSDYITRERVCPVVYDFDFLVDDPFYMDRIRELHMESLTNLRRSETLPESVNRLY